MKNQSTMLFAVMRQLRETRSLKWLVLVLLADGVPLVTADTAEQSHVQGCMAAAVACCCSEFARMYFERI